MPTNVTNEQYVLDEDQLQRRSARSHSQAAAQKISEQYSLGRRPRGASTSRGLQGSSLRGRGRPPRNA